MYQAAVAQEKVAESDAQYQADQLTKQQALSAKGVGTGSDLDNAKNNARRAQETTDVARVAVAYAKIALGGMRKSQRTATPPSLPLWPCAILQLTKCP